MANSLTNEIPKILEMGKAVLRENAIMPKYVNRDYDGAAAQKGAAINIPLANDFAVRNVSPAATHSDTGMNDINPTVKTCTLDQWKEAPFVLSDKEYKEVQSGVVPNAIESAVAALANDVDQSIMALYTKVGNAVGTAGTTPFATIADATEARKYLVDNKMPMDGKVAMVLDASAEANALELSTFHQADQSGGTAGLNEAYIGRKFGMDWMVDQNVATHTTGTLTNGTIFAAKVNNASVAVGDVTVDIDETSLTGTIVAGDTFTVAGDTQTYTVLTGATAAANAIAGMSFFPAAKVAWADDAVITFKGTVGGSTYTNNLCFHRDAFVLASRPLNDIIVPGSQIAYTTDPVTGLTLRLEVSRQNKRTQWSFDILYGVTELRPELAVRVLG